MHLDLKILLNINTKIHISTHPSYSLMSLSTAAASVLTGAVNHKNLGCWKSITILCLLKDGPSIISPHSTDATLL